MTGETFSKSSEGLPPESLSANDVESFLIRHPDFFEDRRELLETLEIPHGGAGSISLVERQVTLLRERNIAMRSHLAELTHNAETSEAILEASQRMILAVLQSRKVTDLGATIEAGLTDFFGVEYASHVWLSPAAESLGDVVPCETDRQTIIETLLRRQRAYCGVFRADEMSAMFPGCTTEGSAAIAPLHINESLIGAVGVGSSDVHRYDNSVGTLFLEHLAQIIMHLPEIKQKPIT
jgi:uncharacterized protein YigA (DUF484 family)